MENLTLAQKIIRPHTIDPLEGHTVVVFETVGTSGEEFRFEIEAGQRVPQTRLDLWGWLRGRRSDDKYFAYAVSGAPQLHETFSTHVTMDVQAYAFDLVVDLAYRVETPRLVVTWRNEDPVKRVREEVARRIGREFAQQNWMRVCDDFRELEGDILDTTLEPLRDFASRYGLRIDSIALSHALPPEYFDEIRKAEAIQRAKAEAARQEELKRAQNEAAAQTAEQQEQLKRRKLEEESQTHALAAERQEQLKRRKLQEELQTQAITDRADHQRRILQIGQQDEQTVEANKRKIARQTDDAEVAHHARLQLLADTAIEAAADALKRAAESISNPQQLAQAIREIQIAVAEIQEFPLRAGQRGELAGGGSRMALGSYQNGAPEVIAGMFVRTERMACQRHEREKLQSAVLLIVGELLRGKEADESRIAEQQELLKTARAEINLPLEDVEYFTTFLDTNKIRSELR